MKNQELGKLKNRNSLFTIHNSGGRHGFTLIEVLVAIGLFALITSAIFVMSANVLEIITRNRWRVEAVNVVENEIETVRNMNYTDVGIQGGYPIGKLQAEKIVSARGLNFNLKTTVRNIDDPFDGIQGGAPNDTAPADYKLVEFEVECLSCPTQFNPITMTTTVSPKDLETTTNNGSIFINVFDAFGLPVSGADVHVFNSSASPTITIDDETNISGVLQLVDIPTSTQAYEITVTKPGYSSEQTYQPGDPGNPNPTKPHATVATQAITSISFAIDKESTLNMDTSDEFCAGVSNIDFNMDGTKLIGTDPNILKYSASSTTGASGTFTMNNVEWDTYVLTNTDAGYDIAGSSPTSSSVIVNPDSTVNVRWLVEPVNPSALRVAVQDDTGALVEGASVRLEGAGFDQTLYTGRRTFSQTDWSGGRYDSQSGGVETNIPAGEISLTASGTIYSTGTAEWLISQTFDLGTSSTDFNNISWNPASQPPQTGIDSLKFQIATNNDDSTWNFVGPDGTAGTYYNSSSSTLHVSHDGNRYLRYKAFLKTDDENFTPTLEDITFGFSSGCIPNGQVFWNGLTNGTYTITVNKPGFQTFTDSSVSVSSNWQEYIVVLTP